MKDAGFGEENLKEIQKLIDAENSDLFDVLQYVAFVKPTLPRIERAMATRPGLNKALTTNQVDFIDFVLERYVATGVEELDDERLPDLIKLKYQALQDGITALGGIEAAREAFIGFQQFLYQTG